MSSPITKKQKLDEKKEEVAPVSSNKNSKLRKELEINGKDLNEEKLNACKIQLGKLGYEFNKSGELRSISNGEKFKFIDQDHYDLLGEQVMNYIQCWLRYKYNLREIILPINKPHLTRDIATSNIFMSNDALSNPHKLLVIVQGSGAVRPGQWARSLCINDSLHTGAIFNYLDKAISRGYSLMILNPNQNIVHTNVGKTRVEGSESPSRHVAYCWREFISKSKAENIVFIAHSYGGQATVDLLASSSLGPQARQRIKAVAFTDSVHSVYRAAGSMSDETKTYLAEKVQNWIRSKTSVVGQLVSESKEGCPAVTAGTPSHELTSANCIEDLWSWIDNKIE